MSSAIVMDGVLDLRILSGSGLKEFKAGFRDLRPSIHQVVFYFSFFLFILDLTEQSSG